MQAHGWFTVMSELHGAIEPAVRLCAVIVKLPFGAPVARMTAPVKLYGDPLIDAGCAIELDAVEARDQAVPDLRP